MASLRDEMPETAAFVAWVREHFGTAPADLAELNANIRAGMQGQPTFYACENGHTIGRRDARQGITPTFTTKPASGPAIDPLASDLARSNRRMRA